MPTTRTRTIQVKRVPRPTTGPYQHACWALKPGAYTGHCTFVKGHDGPHQWEWAERIAATAQGVR